MVGVEFLWQCVTSLEKTRPELIVVLRQAGLVLDVSLSSLMLLLVWRLWFQRWYWGFVLHGLPSLIVSEDKAHSLVVDLSPLSKCSIRSRKYLLVFLLEELVVILVLVEAALGGQHARQCGLWRKRVRGCVQS